MQIIRYVHETRLLIELIVSMQRDLGASAPGGCPIAENYSKAEAWVHDTVTRLTRLGIEYVETGVPVRGSALFAVQHGSWFETILPFIWGRPYAPAIIAKQELSGVPILGSVLHSLDAIFIDRSAPDMRTFRKDVEAAVAAGRDIVIFPEGTRRCVPRVKPGVAFLWEQAALPLQIVTHNAECIFPRGWVWGSCSGTFTLEFGPVIEPGSCSKRALCCQLNKAYRLEGERK